MANKEHLAILMQGVAVWNQWRAENRIANPVWDIRPDLSDANLCDADLNDIDLHGTILRGAQLRGILLNGANLFLADLHGADLRWSNLIEANMTGASLSKADLSESELYKANLRVANLSGAKLLHAGLSEADLSETNLSEANLDGADLSGADLSGANLYRVSLFQADLSEADLSEADLRQATLIGTRFENAILSRCRIYGIAAWNVNLEGATQSDLIISASGKAEITVDNLEIAQFVYMLLNNAKIRDMIDTLTTKSVLILGRFTEERKAVLDAIREELRRRNYIPILFDFEKPASRDLTETIVTLAHLSRFIIADITDAKSIPQELQAIVPNLPSVAVQPIIHVGQREYAMFEHFKRFPWVLDLHTYDDQAMLISEISEKVIGPAEKKVAELRRG